MFAGPRGSRGESVNRPHCSRRRPPARAAFSPRQTTFASPSTMALPAVGAVDDDVAAEIDVLAQRAIVIDRRPAADLVVYRHPSDRLARIVRALNFGGGRELSGDACRRHGKDDGEHRDDPIHAEPLQRDRQEACSACIRAGAAAVLFRLESSPNRMRLCASRGSSRSSPHVRTFGTTPYFAGSEPSALSTS